MAKGEDVLSYEQKIRNGIDSFCFNGNEQKTEIRFSLLFCNATVCECSSLCSRYYSLLCILWDKLSEIIDLLSEW